MATESTSTSAAVTRDPTQTVSIRGTLVTALLIFVGLIFARVGAVFLAGWVGLDESEQMLLVRPVVFASNVALLALALIGFKRYVFARTFGADMGTRFNKAWNDLKDPWHVVLSYLILGGFLCLSFALLLGMN